MQPRLPLLFFLVTVWTHPALSSNIITTIDGDSRTYTADKIQTGEELSSEEWNALGFESPVPSEFGSNDFHTRRIRFRITNPTDIEVWYLTFEKQADWVEMHTVCDGELLASEYSGNLVPMNRRSLYHNTLVLPLRLPRGKPLQVYIRASDFQSVDPAFSVVTPQAFLKKELRRNIVTSFLISIMFIAALYNLSVFFVRRHRYNLYYSICIFMLMIAQMGQHRFLSTLFLPDRSYGFFFYVFCNSAAVIAGILFAVDFVDIRRLRIVRIIAAVVIGALSVIAILSIWLSGPGLGDIMNAVIIPALAGALILFVLDARTGYRPSRITLLSMAPLLLFALLDNFFIYLGISPLWPRSFTQFIGISLHIFLMTGAMSLQHKIAVDRLRTIRAEFDSQLESRVRERTRVLSEIALTDPLSGLYNRACLDETLDALEKRQGGSETTGIIFIDMDNFKFVNDTYGHGKGDAILKRVADYLKSRTRETDLVFRYGGDEFLIVMPSSSLPIISVLTERLHRDFSPTVAGMTEDLGIPSANLSLSIGVYIHASDGSESLSTAVQKADQAMLNAKKQGKDRICHFRPG